MLNLTSIIKQNLALSIFYILAATGWIIFLIVAFGLAGLAALGFCGVAITVFALFTRSIQHEFNRI